MIMKLARLGVLVVVAIPIVPLFLLALGVAIFTLIDQFLAGFIDLRQATWASALNPEFLLGFASIGGTGGPLDSLVAGPGSPGGSVLRFATFGIACVLLGAAFAVLKVTWVWALDDSKRGNR